MFELMDSYSQRAVIKVIGVGGGGGNAVQHMLSAEIDGVEFICANTDAQVLKNSPVKTTLQLGADITKGLGAGANPDIGRQAAMDDRDRIGDVLEGADMVFITAGMGGGTGTGAAPVVAQIAKEMGILTVAVVTRPFPFEGRKRAAIADQGIKDLAQYVDSLITIPNEKLLSVLGRDISLLDAFKAANDVLLGAVQGIAELITCPGLINVDFADVRTVMSEMGMAMMGTGVPAVRTGRASPPRPPFRARCWRTSICPAPRASWSMSPRVSTSPWASSRKSAIRSRPLPRTMRRWWSARSSTRTWKTRSGSPWSRPASAASRGQGRADPGRAADERRGVRRATRCRLPHPGAPYGR